MRLISRWSHGRRFHHFVCYVNPAFCSLAGKNRNKLIGNSIADVIPEGNQGILLLDRITRTGRNESHTQLGIRSPMESAEATKYPMEFQTLVLLDRPISHYIEEICAISNVKMTGLRMCLRAVAGNADFRCETF